MYEPHSEEVSLSRGDILDDCLLPIGVDLTRVGSADVEQVAMQARVIVLTQACDLAQGKTTKVLVAVVNEARVLVEQGILKPATIRDTIRRHQVFGWYFLPASTSSVQFPESIVDLRELHTLHRGILERMITEGKRVCRLATPYREHLAQHFGVAYMRIGLPEPYPTKP
ncbi:MAG TPA: hypothetical protein VF590_18405 [Isosphaeraceae bacterium]|jgi:hypothetical protein